MTNKQTESTSTRDSAEPKPAKSKIKFENKLPRQEAVAYFEAIIESLKTGALSFTQGDDTVELSPGETVDIEVKASKKGAKEKVSIELSWDTDEQTLEISASSAS